MKTLFLLTLLLTLVIPAHADGITYGGDCLTGAIELSGDFQAVHSLIELPVSEVAWLGYGNYSEYGQEGFDTPRWDEMGLLWYFAGKHNGRDFIIVATTHDATPDKVYIWTLPTQQTTDANGNHLGNHPLCPTYVTSLAAAQTVQ